MQLGRPPCGNVSAIAESSNSSDDEYLSDEAYLESNDDVSLLHGLVYVSRLFRCE